MLATIECFVQFRALVHSVLQFDLCNPSFQFSFVCVALEKNPILINEKKSEYPCSTHTPACYYRVVTKNHIPYISEKAFSCACKVFSNCAIVGTYATSEIASIYRELPRTSFLHYEIINFTWQFSFKYFA